MTGTILIIEDDKDIADLITLYLEQEGITVKHVPSGEEGLELLRSEKYDLLVLDLNLPGLDGYEVLQAIRNDISIPVLIVSARVDDADMILGFGYGADDFVQKPFSPKVLSARIRAHLRREKRKFGDSSRGLLTFGEYQLNLEDFVLKQNDERVLLSPKEMAVLCELARAEGSPVSQEDLYLKVWGNRYGDLTTVSVHVQRLRKKLEEDPSNPRYITTVYGYGYALKSGTA